LAYASDRRYASAKQQTGSKRETRATQLKVFTEARLYSFFATDHADAVVSEVESIFTDHH